MQIALLVHTLLDKLVKLFPIVVLNLVDLIPGILFNVLALRLVHVLELLDFFLLLLVLLLLLLFLKLMLLVHLGLRLVLSQEELLDVLLEVHLLVLLGLE